MSSIFSFRLSLPQLGRSPKFAFHRGFRFLRGHVDAGIEAGSVHDLECAAPYKIAQYFATLPVRRQNEILARIEALPTAHAANPENRGRVRKTFVRDDRAYAVFEALKPHLFGLTPALQDRYFQTAKERGYLVALFPIVQHVAVDRQELLARSSLGIVNRVQP